MRFNFIGVCQSLTAVEGTKKSFVQLVYEDDQPATLSGYVFTLAIEGRAEQTLETDPTTGGVLVALPALDAGSYGYEIAVTEEATGSRLRMFYGTLEVVPALEVTEAATLTSAPVMRTFLPADDGGSLRWDWMAANAACYYAAQAATGAAQVAEVLSDLPELVKFKDDFEADIQNAITIGSDGNWVIAGKNIGKPSRGESGVDGTSLRFVSMTTLPTEGEVGYAYVVGPNVFVWDSVNESWIEYTGYAQLATSSVYGFVKLGYKGTDGVQVEMDDTGLFVSKLELADAVPAATTTSSGTVQLAAAVSEEATGVPTAAMVATALSGKADASAIQSIVDAAVDAAVQAAVQGLGVPQVGDIKLTFSATVPDGYLALNGQTISKTTYAALYAFLLENGAVTSDGKTMDRSSEVDGMFRLPDFGGCFPRFIGDGSGRTLDAGRAPGSYQTAAAPNVTATWTVTPYDAGLNCSSGLYVWQGTSDGYKAYSLIDTANPKGYGQTMGPTGAARLVFDRSALTVNGKEYETAFYLNTGVSWNVTNAANYCLTKYDFDASRCSAVYGDVAEVRPYNAALFAYIKY